MLLRVAFNTKRHGAGGRADADVYKEMVHAISDTELQREAIKNNQRRVSSKTLEQLEYDERVAIARVRSNVREAINEAVANTELKFASEETIKKLRYLQSKLGVSEYDRRLIDNVISEAWDIFRDNKLTI
ncbi:MAG: hypothetical protein IM613_18980 [Cytophagales bacterium]|nr:hypothetical protein [Cytophagales bacterium]